jgi:hypothetical protein
MIEVLSTHVCEYGTLKAVGVTLRRGLGKKEE